LVIDSDFPSKPPKGFFFTKIFHPNVAVQTGEICVNTLKKDWDPCKWSLRHIFEVIKCLLIVPFPESSLNEEAGRLFMENYEQFYSQAKLYTDVHAGNKNKICFKSNNEEEKIEEKSEQSVLS
jgi:ubiquitin-conjugating enzyme E2 S